MFSSVSYLLNIFDLFTNLFTIISIKRGVKLHHSLADPSTPQKTLTNKQEG
jgi:hypothetical protein